MAQLLGPSPNGGTYWQREDGSQFETPYPIDMFGGSSDPTGQTSYLDQFGQPPQGTLAPPPATAQEPPVAPAEPPAFAPELSAPPTPYAGAPAPPVPPSPAPQAAPAPSPRSVAKIAAQGAQDAGVSQRAALGLREGEDYIDTPEGIARIRERTERDRSWHQRAEMEKLQAADEARAIRNEKDRADAQAKTDKDLADIRKLADEVRNAKIDENAIWAGEGGTMRKILGLASIFAAGIANPDGPNQAAAIINQAIERNIQTQLANLENKRADLGERRALLDRFVTMTGDRYKSAEAVRQAAYQRSLDVLSTAMMQFEDPMIRAKYAETIQQVQAAANERAQKAAAETFERELKLREQERKEFDSREQARHARAQEGIAYRGQSLDFTKHQQSLAMEAQRLRASGNEAAAKAKEAEAKDRAAREIRDTQGNTIGVAGDAQVAHELNGKVAATTDLVRTLDEMIAIRNSVGRRWIPGVDTEGEEQLRVKHARALGVIKNADKLGTLDKGLLEYAGRLLGERPDGWKDFSTEWKTLRDDAVKGVNDSLRTEGNVKGLTWTPYPDAPSFQKGDTAGRAPEGLPPSEPTTGVLPFDPTRPTRPSLGGGR